MKSTPPGWPRITPSVYYADAKPMLAWLCQAFGFTIRHQIEDSTGHLRFAQLAYDDGLITVSDERSDRPHRHAPSTIGGANTMTLTLFVDDVDAHCAHARAAGAVIVSEPFTRDHGADFWTDRSYECRDPGGHYWWFIQRLRSAAKPG
jgi:uncharacterized glyoxalase superfamily protein PhnB